MQHCQDAINQALVSHVDSIQVRTSIVFRSGYVTAKAPSGFAALLGKSGIDSGTNNEQKPAPQ